MSGATNTDGWLDETRSAYLYRVLAEVERGTPRSTLFDGLAREAEAQAAIWAKSAGLASVPKYRPDLRTRVVAALARHYGPRAIRGILAAMKVRGLSVYSHAAPGHPAPTSVEDIGMRHRSFGGKGNLRAAVFGVNDGLVSNVSLILGIAGASSNNSFILLTGTAGLLAGAFSMAAGEYVSVRSQREMYEHQIELERAELDEYPKAEAEELALIYAARGMPKDEAHELATRTIADPKLALDTLAREELGLNPDELGSPWGASLSSFFSFAAGAAVPLVPFLLSSGDRALISAILLTAVSLFSVGALISLFTGRSAVRDGLRMLAIGAGAGAITYAIGRLMGVSLS
jgi:VIT1/CCC1 family predicted Fe2+/Mn2+ transporter